MEPHEKLNTVLRAIANNKEDGMKGVRFPVLSKILLRDAPDLSPKNSWEIGLSVMLERLEIDDLTTINLISTVHESGQKIGEYWTNLSENGRDLLLNGGYTNDTKFIEISDRELNTLALLLPIIPYYEPYSTLNLMADIGSFYTYGERLKMFEKKSFEKRIADFLHKYGFSKSFKDYDVILTDEGRKLKDAGGYDEYLLMAEKEKEKEDYRNTTQDALLRYQKENAEWQREYGNPILKTNRILTIFGLIISSAGIIMTFYIAKYIRVPQPPPPVKNYIYLDSNVVKEIILNKKQNRNDRDSGKKNWHVVSPKTVTP